MDLIIYFYVQITNFAGIGFFSLKTPLTYFEFPSTWVFLDFLSSAPLVNLSIFHEYHIALSVYLQLLTFGWASPPTLHYFFSNVLAVLCPLLFHTHFRIGWPHCLKQVPVGTLILIGLWTNVVSTDIFKISRLFICEYDIFQIFFNAF